MNRTAAGAWTGPLKEGKGSLSARTILSQARYTYSPRVADTPGTNPEELLAAALASNLTLELVVRLFAIAPTLTAKLASANSRHAPMPARPAPGDVILHASPTGI